VVDAAESELGYANTFSIGKAMALTALDLINDPEKLAEIKREFESSMAKRQASN
jgi:hypothetical protein